MFLENDIKRYSRERESDKTKGEVSGAYLQNSLKVLPSKEEVGCLWMRTQLYSCTTSVWWVDFLGSELPHLLNNKCEHEEFKGLLWVAQIFTRGFSAYPVG